MIICHWSERTPQIGTLRFYFRIPSPPPSMLQVLNEYRTQTGVAFWALRLRFKKAINGLEGKKKKE